ncbi:MAG TPA: hypothetical protein VL137_18745 [Polyangiaceae bacterium]|nr:hypothetical protein [Polyangiaceae bacterium]
MSSSRRRPAFLPLLGLLLCSSLFGLGCEDLSRFRQCDRLSSKVNPMLAQIEELGAQGKQPTPRTYAQIADRYAALNRAVKALPITDPRLSAALVDYQGMIATTEKKLRETASALRKNKNPQEQQSRYDVAMSGVLQQEQAVLGRIRGMCKP